MKSVDDDYVERQKGRTWPDRASDWADDLVIATTAVVRAALCVALCRRACRCRRRAG